MPTQSADLKANLVRVGLNYRGGAPMPASAYADTGYPWRSRNRRWSRRFGTNPIGNSMSGTRRLLERRVDGATNPLSFDAQHLKSRLIWADLDARSGETYGRVDHVSGWFVKGFLGAGGILQWKIERRGFPGHPRVRVFQYVFVQYRKPRLCHDRSRLFALEVAWRETWPLRRLQLSHPARQCVRLHANRGGLLLYLVLFRTTSSFRRMLASTRCASVSQPNSC